MMYNQDVIRKGNKERGRPMTRQVATMTLCGVYKVIYDDTKREYRVIRKINGKQKTVAKYRSMHKAMEWLYNLALISTAHETANGAE